MAIADQTPRQPLPDRDLIDRLPIAMVVADEDASAVLTNRAWSELTAGAEWRHHDWLGIVAAPHRTDVREALVAAARSSTPYDTTWPITGADGTARTVRVTAARDPHAPPESCLIVALLDITAQQDETELLRHRATHDPLTGLCNRGQFLEFVDHALERQRRDPERVTAVLFIDIDELKATNDAFGHAAGDALLKRVAAQVVDAVRPSDIVGRYGGDEFTVLCEDLADAEEADAIAERIRSVVHATQAGFEPVRLSIGSAVTDGTFRDPVRIIGAADDAMYTAKSELRRLREVTGDEAMSGVTVRAREDGLGAITVTVHDDGAGVAEVLVAALLAPFVPAEGIGMTGLRRAVASAGGRLHVERLPLRGSLLAITLPSPPGA